MKDGSMDGWMDGCLFLSLLYFLYEWKVVD
jgi:hypothetical protein